MKNLRNSAFALILLSIVSCSTSSTHTDEGSGTLPARQFSERISQAHGAVVIDVRTPEEFAKGHLPNAVNIDWNNEGFDNALKNLDKSKQFFIYCLSGGRSAAAANNMRQQGFKKIYELDGGIMSWRAAGLEESTTASATNAGMTKEQFEALLDGNKPVLVDFYADWCAPCKLMKPYMDEIKNNRQEKLSVISINADDNPELLTLLHIEALPTLLLYKNKTESWRNTGFIEKNALLEKIN